MITESSPSFSTTSDVKEVIHTLNRKVITQSRGPSSFIQNWRLSNELQAQFSILLEGEPLSFRGNKEIYDHVRGFSDSKRYQSALSSIELQNLKKTEPFLINTVCRYVNQFRLKKTDRSFLSLMIYEQLKKNLELNREIIDSSKILDILLSRWVVSGTDISFEREKDLKFKLMPVVKKRRMGRFEEEEIIKYIISIEESLKENSFNWEEVEELKTYMENQLIITDYKRKDFPQILTCFLRKLPCSKEIKTHSLVNKINSYLHASDYRVLVEAQTTLKKSSLFKNLGLNKENKKLFFALLETRDSEAGYALLSLRILPPQSWSEEHRMCQLMLFRGMYLPKKAKEISCLIDEKMPPLKFSPPDLDFVFYWKRIDYYLNCLSDKKTTLKESIPTSLEWQQFILIKALFELPKRMDTIALKVIKKIIGESQGETLWNHYQQAKKLKKTQLRKEGLAVPTSFDQLDPCYADLYLELFDQINVIGKSIVSVKKISKFYGKGIEEIYNHNGVPHDQRMTQTFLDEVDNAFYLLFILYEMCQISKKIECSEAPLKETEIYFSDLALELKKKKIISFSESSLENISRSLVGKFCCFESVFPEKAEKIIEAVYSCKFFNK